MPQEEKILVHRNKKITIPERLLAYGLWCPFCTTFQPQHEKYARNCSFEQTRRRYFEHYSISHMHSGLGHLWLQSGLEADIHPGDVVLIAPGVINRYGGFAGQPYREDTITFLGPVADRMRNAGFLVSGIYHLGPVRRLLPIQDYLRSPSIDDQIKGLIDLQALLIELYLARQSEKKSGQPILVRLLQNIRKDPYKWWTVKELADMCNVCPDHLRRLFIQNTGITPKLYLDRFKLQQAGDLLQNSGKSIREIAALFGYTTPCHFSRRFKTVMGISPGQYQKNGQTEFIPEEIPGTEKTHTTG